MAIQSKSAIQNGIDTNFADNNENLITPAKLREVVSNMNDSYESVIQSYTSAQRDLIAGPAQGLKIFNTTTKRVEVFSGVMWKPAAQPDSIDKNCSANPNYPAGLIGDTYYVTGQGRIGGASGKEVFVGDLIICAVNNAGGTESDVGTSWRITHSAGDDFKIFRSPSLKIVKADINSLYTTKIPIISSPGAGKIVIPVAYCFEYSHDTTPYADDTGIVLVFDGTDNPVCTLCGPLSDLIESDIICGNRLNNSIKGWKVNAALYVKATGADPTGGGAESYIRIQLYYKIHTIGLNEVDTIL